MAALALATRIAGGLIATVYLLGLIGGPVFGVLGGFFLAAFGRALHLDQPRLVLAAIALGILAAGLTLGAARWGSPDLDHIRGAQAVLGPALLVGPTAIGLGNACLATASLLGGIVWLGSLSGLNRFGWTGLALEAILVAFALLAVFWWPAAHAGSWTTGRGASVLVAAAVGISLIAMGVWTQRSWPLARALVSAAALALLAGVWLVGAAS